MNFSDRLVWGILIACALVAIITILSSVPVRKNYTPVKVTKIVITEKDVALVTKEGTFVKEEIDCLKTPYIYKVCGVNIFGYYNSSYCKIECNKND